MNNIIGGPMTYDVVTCYNPSGGYSQTCHYENSVWNTVTLMEQNKMKMVTGIPVHGITVPDDVYPSICLMNWSSTTLYFNFNAAMQHIDFEIVVSLNEYHHDVNCPMDCELQTADGQNILLQTITLPSPTPGNPTFFKFNVSTSIAYGPTTGTKTISFRTREYSEGFDTNSAPDSVNVLFKR